MSLNASTTSVIINSLNSGGLYTARVAGLTHVGSGPFSMPILLNMDPEQLNQQPPRSNSNREKNSIINETWFLVLMVIMLLSIIAALMGTFYLKRRQTLSKQLGHLNVPVGTSNDICQLNKDTLWLERGWRPTNNLQCANDKDCETKLLNNQMVGSGIVSVSNSEYAEVNLTTFYNTRKPSAPPEPYATTTLCVTNRNPNSIETSRQKSNSNDSCVKPDYSSFEFTQEHKSNRSQSSDNSSSIYTDDATEHQRRQPYRSLQSQFQQQKQQPLQDLQSLPLPNWCDMLPPPPEHPPPSENSTPKRSFQSIPVFSSHLGKYTNSQNILDYTSSKMQHPLTPPIRLLGSNLSPLSTPWNSHDSTKNQVRYTSLPPQTNPPPLPSFPQSLDHYDMYKAEENEYESGSLIYGHHNSLINIKNFYTHDSFGKAKQTEEPFQLTKDFIRSDVLYQKENDDWDRKSCESNTHSDMCCSCSESSCLYADTIEYNNHFETNSLQPNVSSCNHSSNHNNKSKTCLNTNPKQKNESSSLTHSSDSNYSCIPQGDCPSPKSQDMLRHNSSKGKLFNKIK
jgi:hypothetical protein